MEHSPVIDPIQIEEKKPHKTEYYRAKNMLYELAASLGCSFDSSEELIFERIEDARVFVDLAAEIGLVYTGTVDVVSSDYDYNWGRVVINLPLFSFSWK